MHTIYIIREHNAYVMCIYMCVCVCVCMYVYVYVCMYMCMYVYVCIYIYKVVSSSKLRRVLYQ